MLKQFKQNVGQNINRIERWLKTPKRVRSQIQPTRLNVNRRIRLADVLIPTENIPEDNLAGGNIARVEKQLKYSLALVPITWAGYALYPPLLLFSALGFIYLSIPSIVTAYRALKDERKIKVELLDLILVVCMMSTGHLSTLSLLFPMLLYSQKLLEKVKYNSEKTLVNLVDAQPRSAWIEYEGNEYQVSIGQLKMGDVVVVDAGEVIPVDGIIQKGVASVDQHILVGEAQPAEKGIGEQVFAMTTVLSGKIWVEIVRAGSETTAAQITELLQQTANFKSDIELQGEKVADRSVLPMLLISAITVPLLGVTAALSVMRCYIGYSMRITAPISLLNFLHLASQNGLLIKDASALERLSEVDTVVFDKTGTLTQEEPHVAQVHICHKSYTETEILTYAAAAEGKQTHPIALAILAEVKQRNLVVPAIHDAAYEIGYGLRVWVGEQLVCVGSDRFMQMESLSMPASLNSVQEMCDDKGYSFIYVAIDDEICGGIELHATIRSEAKRVVSELQQRGLNLCIISGDRTAPTQALATELGIERYIAEVLPTNKADIVEDLQRNGHKVCFVGDGINDSIALQKADVSISLSGASALATDIAQIILMGGSLSRLTNIFQMADELERNMHRNFLISIIPGSLAVAGVYLAHFGIFAVTLFGYTGIALGIGNAMSPLLAKNMFLNQLSGERSQIDDQNITISE